MKRREFMQTGAFLGVAGVTRGLVPGSAAAEPQDESDRSAGRDPLAVQRSTLVVEGLSAGYLNEAQLERLKKGGVNCAVGGGGGDVQGFANSYHFLEEHKDRIVACTTVRGIREAHRQGKMAQVMEWQSAEALGNQFNQAIGSAVIPLRAYYDLGLRICGIAYNVANLFGAGCLEPHIGLTRAGRRLVEEIHKLRMVLDVGGHTGEQTSLDAIAMSSGVPIVCTHTNVRALNDNLRCSSDRLLEDIAKTGGTVGITAFNDFLARNKTNDREPRTPQVGMDKYLDQFDYLRKRIGVGHIALGTDNVEGWTFQLNRTVLAPEAYSEQPWFYVKGYETIAELPNVTRGLIQRGWSTGDIHKVLGQNLLRVWEKVWGA